MIIKNIELNEQFKKALEVMDGTSKNVFITGKAGTGKSTLLWIIFVPLPARES